MRYLIIILYSLVSYGTGFDSLSTKLLGHKESYFLPMYSIDDGIRGASDSYEAKFQISLKVVPVELSWGSLNFAYTQKSFWQLYDGGNSRPFRESNYNPEAFLRFGHKLLYFDVIYEHESNGEEEPRSRGWDRAGVRFGWIAGDFKLSLKYWSVVSEEEFKSTHPERDKSMEYYLGNIELKLGLFALNTAMTSLARYNSSTGYGFWDTKIMWSLTKNVLWGFNFVKGYGDSLRSYNQGQQAVGVGIYVNP